MKVSNIIFSIDKYGGDKEKMYTAIAKQLMLLMENDYYCKIYDDDTDIIVIEYSNDEKKYYTGSHVLMWVTDEEEDEIFAARKTREDN
jgi:hypothetical protein